MLACCVPRFASTGSSMGRARASSSFTSSLIMASSAAQASLISRMVDVETGSILWSGRMRYEGIDVQSTMAGITSSFAKSLVPLWPALHQ